MINKRANVVIFYCDDKVLRDRLENEGKTEQFNMDLILAANRWYEAFACDPRICSYAFDVTHRYPGEEEMNKWVS
jgi:hypothetical protein